MKYFILFPQRLRLGRDPGLWRGLQSGDAAWGEGPVQGPGSPETEAGSGEAAALQGALESVTSVMGV